MPPTARVVRHIIPTPDRRLRVFVSSTLEELASERRAALAAIETMHLTAVMFEAGARAHPPHEVYRDYLAQSDLFVGVYWQSGGWIAPGDELSGLVDEFRLAGDMPRLVYLKKPAKPEPALLDLLDEVRSSGLSYRRFASPDELRELVAEDLAALITERFTVHGRPRQNGLDSRNAGPLERSDPAAMIGRRRELRRALHVLRQGTRILTLVGPGGIGKTTLASAVAAQARPDFRDGVRTVDLTPARSRDDVLAAIAERVGVTSRKDTELEAALIRTLAGQNMLLVLDNFEQVVEAAPILSSLLDEAPEVQLLATSRVPLHLRGEQVFPVPPLALPSHSSRHRARRSSPAIQLFVERARAADPRFSPTPTEITDIAHIVRRLDGIPLAIELAAARVPILSPHGIFERLKGGLGLLAGGRRDSPARHHTMHAAIAWSYELLDPADQRAFRQLAAFDGGFTLDSAAQVVDAGDGVLDVIGSLVAKSLLYTDRDGAETRFRMLGTIHDFARETFAKDADATIVRTRHADYFLRFAEEQEVALRTRMRDTFVSFQLERNNIISAIRHFVAIVDIDRAIRLAWAIWQLWYLDGRAQEGATWFRRILDSSAAAQPETRVLALTGAGLLGLAAAHVDEARTDLSQAVDLAHEVGDEAGFALAGGVLGHLAARDGQLDRAEDLLDESLSTFERRGDEWYAAAMRILHAGVPLLRGQATEAIVAYERALADVRALGDPVLVLLAVFDLACAVEVAGDLERADRLLAEGIVFGRAAGDAAVAAGFAGRRAALARVRGDTQLAAALESTDKEKARSPWLAAFAAIPPCPGAVCPPTS